MNFATFVAICLMLITLIGCTLPAGEYSASVHLPADIVFGEMIPTRETLPTWTVPTPQPARYVTNTTNSAWNIRLEPRVEGRFLERLQPGQSLELQAVLDNGWLQVERADGSTGFVDGRCCVDHG